MRYRYLLAAAATLALAACGESSTAPHSPLQPGTRSSDDITCRSGYHVATRDDGSQYCESDDLKTLSASPSGTSASRPTGFPIDSL